MNDDDQDVNPDDEALATEDLPHPVDCVCSTCMMMEESFYE